MNLKHKEAVMEVRRHLVEAASRENLPVKMSMGKAGAHVCTVNTPIDIFNVGSVSNRSLSMPKR